MNANNDNSQALAEQIKNAATNKTAIKISGGGSKAFYGHQITGEALSTKDHSGIIEYTPSELVITARAGTSLQTIEDELASNNQQLAFEPPIHNERATLGGVIACGLSGPARPFTGAARDYVLGTRIINGNGDILKFGGQVMKNVAGYDASRLMVGAQGTLGVLLDVSVKVLPKPATENTISIDCDFKSAQKLLNTWLHDGTPVSASCFYNDKLTVRLSGSSNSVGKYSQQENAVDDDPVIWQQLCHQKHTIFNCENLWRISVPPATELFEQEKDQLIEWGGALRWITTDTDMFTAAEKFGGHATRYNMNKTDSENIFQPLEKNMLALQKRIKHSFDPHNILNPGRLYPDL